MREIGLEAVESACATGSGCEVVKVWPVGCAICACCSRAPPTVVASLAIIERGRGVVVRVGGDTGCAATLHPFMHRRYPGSGPGARVLEEPGLDGESQARAIRRWLDAIS